jgi:hypothetical protein
MRRPVSRGHFLKPSAFAAAIDVPATLKSDQGRPSLNSRCAFVKNRIWSGSPGNVGGGKSRGSEWGAGPYRYWR